MKTRIVVRVLAAVTGVAAVTWLWNRYHTIDRGCLPVESVLAREAHQSTHYGRHGK